MEDLGLNVKFGGDSNEAQRAVTELQAKTESFSQRIKSLGEAVFFPIEALKKLKDIGEHVFDALVGKSYEAALKLEHLHKQTGISTDSLQRLGKAAKMNEVSIDGMAHSMAILQRNMGAALGGSKEAIAAFQSIGVSATQLKTMKPEDVFIKLADAIKSGAIPEAEQMGVAMKVLGRGAFEMMPMLKAGGDEIRKIGASAVIMSKETIEASEATHIAWIKIEGALKSLSDQILAELIPSVKTASEWIADNLPKAVGYARDRMHDFFDDVRKGWEDFQLSAAASVKVFGLDWNNTIKEMKGNWDALFQASNIGDWWKDTKQGWTELKEILGEMFGTVERAVGTVTKAGITIREAFDALWENARYTAELIGIKLGALYADFDKFASGIYNVIENIIEIVKNAGATVWTMLKESFNNYVSVFNGLVQVVGNVVKSVINVVKDLPEDLGRIFYEAGKAAWESLQNGLSGKGWGIDTREMGAQITRMMNRINKEIENAIKMPDITLSTEASGKAIEKFTNDTINNLNAISQAAGKAQKDFLDAGAEAAAAADENHKQIQKNIADTAQKDRDLIDATVQHIEKVKEAIRAAGGVEAEERKREMEEDAETLRQAEREATAAMKRAAEAQRKARQTGREEDAAAAKAAEREAQAAMDRVRKLRAEIDKLKKEQEAAGKAGEKAGKEMKGGMDKAAGGDGKGGDGGGKGGAKGLKDSIKDAEKAKDSLVDDVKSEVPKAGKVIEKAANSAGKLAENLGKAGAHYKGTAGPRGAGGTKGGVGAGKLVGDTINEEDWDAVMSPQFDKLVDAVNQPHFVMQGKDAWRVESGGKGIKISGGGGNIFGAGGGDSIAESAAALAGIGISRGRLGQAGVFDLWQSGQASEGILMASGLLTQAQLNAYHQAVTRISEMGGGADAVAAVEEEARQAKLYNQWMADLAQQRAMAANSGQAMYGPQDTYAQWLAKRGLDTNGKPIPPPNVKVNTTAIAIASAGGGTQTSMMHDMSNFGAQLQAAASQPGAPSVQELQANYAAGRGPLSNWTQAQLDAQRNAPSVHWLGSGGVDKGEPIEVTGPHGGPVRVSDEPVITSPDLDRWRGGNALTSKVEEISAMLAGQKDSVLDKRGSQDVKIAITQNVGKIDSSVDTQKMLTDLGRRVATELRKAGPLLT